MFASVFIIVTFACCLAFEVSHGTLVQIKKVWIYLLHLCLLVVIHSHILTIFYLCCFAFQVSPAEPGGRETGSDRGEARDVGAWSCGVSLCVPVCGVSAQPDPAQGQGVHLLLLVVLLCTLRIETPLLLSFIRVGGVMFCVHVVVWTRVFIFSIRWQFE